MMRQREYKKIAEILCDVALDTNIDLCDICAYGKDSCREKCEEGIGRGLKIRMNSDN